MIWENEQEIIKELLYWQKRALRAEREVEETLDDVEHYINVAYDEMVAKEYYKQQFLDKDEEMKKVLRMSGDR